MLDPVNFSEKEWSKIVGRISSTLFFVYESELGIDIYMDGLDPANIHFRLLFILDLWRIFLPLYMSIYYFSFELPTWMLTVKMIWRFGSDFKIVE